MKKLAILALPLLALAQPAFSNTQDASTDGAPVVAVAIPTEFAFEEPDLADTKMILMDHIKILASDDFMGRKPGTEGGRMTVAYQVEKLKEYGFEPGWSGSATSSCGAHLPPTRRSAFW